MNSPGAKLNDAQMVRAGETILPAFRKEVFHCQFCQAFVRQGWAQLFTGGSTLVPIWTCECTNCRIISYWYQHPADKNETKMVHPRPISAPLPHPEMPEGVKDEYTEAGSIITASPRGAGALLRLALQKLMPHLGEKGDNLNDDIASLVRKGLDPQVQQALDALRVIGNNAVHPLELDLRDDTATVGALFGLLNFIVEERIARPQKLASLYEELPEGAREAITKRDAPQA